jgi:hypothetical protein
LSFYVWYELNADMIGNEIITVFDGNVGKLLVRLNLYGKRWGWGLSVEKVMSADGLVAHYEDTLH